MKLTIHQIEVEVAHQKIVRNVSLEVPDKKTVGLIGANGSGKSTLLKSIYKSIAPTQGTIYLDDLDVLKAPNKKIAEHLGVVGQFNELNFDLTVEQMVLLGRTPHKKMMEADTLYDYQRVQEALLRTNLMNYKDRSYLSLSGGEKQRVILARTIAQEPKIMILDETTNHLDIRYQLEILTAVKDLNITTFVALHDLELTADYCDYIYALKDGELIAQGVPEEVLTEALITEIYQVQCQIYENPITHKLAFHYSI
ncbi:MAG: ABC transporter ATP-binding protein [Streptococcaceae bacterium]|jgi:iron complex transport system ATP-binding protein|nr:ABC transporter ATP-binding protein [Streptococcaceae bacterium]